MFDFVSPPVVVCLSSLHVILCLSLLSVVLVCWSLLGVRCSFMLLYVVVRCCYILLLVGVFVVCTWLWCLLTLVACWFC